MIFHDHKIFFIFIALATDIQSIEICYYIARRKRERVNIFPSDFAFFVEIARVKITIDIVKIAWHNWMRVGRTYSRV